MAGETLSGTYKTGITLTSSLATLTGAAVINAPSSAIGIYIPASLGTFTLFTSGHVTAGPAPPPNSLASYTQGDGIVADASGYIANAGTIRGIANAAAIGITMAGAAASVTNLTSAVIYGYTDGISIESNNANSATVSNAGLISAGHGANDAGVRIVTGGGALDLTNLAKGTISGGEAGVELFENATSLLSLSNAGTIASTINFAAILNAAGGAIINNTGIIAGGGGGIDLGAAGAITLANAGHIESVGSGYINGTATVADGLVLNGNGIALTNSASASIYGLEYGLLASLTTLTANNLALTNSGTIASQHLGALLYGGGNFTNAAGALLEATSTAATATALADTLTTGATLHIVNLGTILTNGSGHDGIIINGGGLSLTQASTGLIKGDIAVTGAGAYLNLAGTLTNGLQLAAGYANTVKLEPGVVLGGALTLGTGTLSTLILGSASTAGSLDINAANGGIDFASYPGHISFATGAKWFLEGDVPNLTNGITLTGFTAGDTIELQDFMQTASHPGGYLITSDTFANNKLTITENNNQHFTIDIAGSFTTANFSIKTIALTSSTIDPVSQASLIEIVPCFAAGTRILTPQGERPVEQLAAGDLVITSTGEDAPLIWVGRRHISLRRHPAPHRVRPVRIRAGALADNVPARDLFLSPEHALYLHGGLIPVRHLINHTSIAQIDVAEVTYLHLELATHSIIFAEYAAAESYLDCGARGAFENSGEAMQLHADFGGGLRRANSCALVHESGLAVAAARARIAARVRTPISDAAAPAHSRSRFLRGQPG